jgi:hypothetical protein
MANQPAQAQAARSARAVHPEAVALAAPGRAPLAPLAAPCRRVSYVVCSIFALAYRHGSGRPLSRCGHPTPTLYRNGGANVYALFQPLRKR